MIPSLVFSKNHDMAEDTPSLHPRLTSDKRVFTLQSQSIDCIARFFVKLTFSNGSEYVGDVKNNKMNGKVYFLF